MIRLYTDLLRRKFGEDVHTIDREKELFASKIILEEKAKEIQFHIKVVFY